MHITQQQECRMNKVHRTNEKLSVQDNREEIKQEVQLHQKLFTGLKTLHLKKCSKCMHNAETKLGHDIYTIQQQCFLSLACLLLST
jgi:hypothetical protein